ncbi:unnamed protein product [Cuscuta campestris]|uniref:Uncharacterized protein n=1 Tax=Cuscuta campestris TaxID=132261 RepID=A0A484MV17_9ASTE|nr:unnamed protein product [Cuscuta campestris]
MTGSAERTARGSGSSSEGRRRWIDARVAMVLRLVPPEVKHARGLADLGGCSPTLVEGTTGGPVSCSLLAGKIPAVRGSPAVRTIARCHCLWLAEGSGSSSGRTACCIPPEVRRAGGLAGGLAGEDQEWLAGEERSSPEARGCCPWLAGGRGSSSGRTACCIPPEVRRARGLAGEDR